MNLRQTSEGVADRLNKQVARQTANLTKQAAALLDRASGLAERVDTMQADMTRRVVPQPKPRRGMTVLLLVAGAAAGYVAAYFMDAERGRSRRAEIARQFEGMGREANRIAQRSAIVATDKASGIKSRVMPRGDDGDTDDLTILDRVESEVFRDPTIPKGDINVMVVEGKAVLRGQVPEKQIGAIEAAVRKVVGVRDVENLLHVAGTPAPNTASARSATGEGSGTSV